ncbi:MAG: hypothetical protein U0521_08320 [Anaerolineae bacterium]
MPGADPGTVLGRRAAAAPQPTARHAVRRADHRRALLLTDIPAAIVGWTLAAALLAWNHADYPRWYLALGASVLGIGLAGCFWVPAFAEAEAVQWIERARDLPYLITLAELFTLLRQIDPARC